MVSSAIESDYIKADTESMGPAIERYIRSLEPEGRSPGGLEKLKNNLKLFFRYAPTTEPSVEQFSTVKKELENHGYGSHLIKEVMSNTGKFYIFSCGINPWQELYPTRNTSWYVVPDAPFGFSEELENFRLFLETEPYSDNMKKKHFFHAKKALRILAYEKRVSKAAEIDFECFEILEKYLDNSSKIVRTSVLYSIGLFVQSQTGCDLYQKYLNGKEPKYPFEESEQWKRMMECIDQYVADATERGYTKVSTNNLRTHLVTTARRMFRLVGSLYPEEINFHHFRKYRNLSTDLKDRTIKADLGYLGRMLEFTVGKNPNRGAQIMWAKQSIDRTWIFKDEWKKIFTSATTAERVALVLCAGLGLRRNEVATLKLSDFVGDRVIIKGKGHGQGKIMEKEVPKSVAAVIQDYLPERAELINRFGDRYDGCLLVPPFYSNGKTSMNRFVGELVTRAASRVGVKATCHTFRRFYCTNLLDNGFDLDTVRRMMRHASLDTTMDCYIHADPRKMKDATSSVDDALFG